jgi:hypothetical protein
VIEDSASAVLLMDTEKDQLGMSGHRKFIEILDTSADAEEFNDPVEYRPLRARLRESGITAQHYVVSFGEVLRIEPAEQSYKIEGFIDEIYYFGEDGISFHAEKDQLYSQPLSQRIVEAGLKNSITALEEVLFFNQPHSFVVEASPIKPRQTKTGRVTRSHDRPHFTILPAGEVRQKLGLPQATPGTRGTPTPHERRRHWRTLKSEKYTRKKGQRILIPASWVGPSEAKVGNKYYKVRFDL